MNDLSSKRIRPTVIVFGLLWCSTLCALSRNPGASGGGLVAQDSGFSSRLIQEAVLCTLERDESVYHSFSLLGNGTSVREKIRLGFYRYDDYVSSLVIRIGRLQKSDAKDVTYEKPSAEKRNRGSAAAVPRENGAVIRNLGGMHFEKNILTVENRSSASGVPVRFYFDDTTGYRCFPVLRNGSRDRVDYLFSVEIQPSEKIAIYCSYRGRVEDAGPERGMRYYYHPEYDHPWKEQLRSTEIRIVLKHPEKIRLQYIVPEQFEKRRDGVSWNTVSVLRHAVCAINFFIADE